MCVRRHADSEEVLPEEPASVTCNMCDRFDGQAFHSMATTHEACIVQKSFLTDSLICVYSAIIITVGLLSA